MPVKIKKLHPAAVTPTYATPGAACFDLYAADDALEHEVKNPYPGHPLIISTGLVFEIPDGHYMQILSRSGLAFKHGYTVFPGVVDSDYRGVVMVKLMGENYGGPGIKSGDRIAQALILPVEQVAFEWAEELSETQRGAGGFGSTGSK